MAKRKYSVKPKHYSEVDQLINLLLLKHHKVLGEKLIGMYMFGALVIGDFDYEISDIDLVAATSSDLDTEELEKLKKMHEEIAAENKTWADRIEVGYISLEKLRRYNPNDRQGLISPGEPLHTRTVGKDWIINRYVLREKGITLFGPPAETIIDPISKEELKKAVKDLTKEWEEWMTHTEIMRPRKYQAYSILTLCRSLYEYRNADIVSKREAAEWAKKELPEWSSLIENALIWRQEWRNEEVDHDSTLPETMRFLRFVINQIVA
ncbi:hypothetical protein A3B51_02385 [Candidatus Curtissbacteria bacterium RIFCSPLOWO2_01_FULL_41_18]|uniref:Adenylyltransferase AadA C-terminal domain-containing protein n=2 Tax=Candidatus Curtissiibacteriota TaxID=1752717 RepID=A0A1F5G0D3_9BACT|nr:MAG: hypothetical protein A2696_02790 [Candidatus Curtissbacteria bacterium RIFCSPHIGHO2_01_FULL_41_13]OGE04412.1 MAG: hypothetical protein A3B51_02385 [Candidatus Curtissbacteria bacterium RIFCSPLOWO2_01_FULL_41_18]